MTRTNTKNSCSFTGRLSQEKNVFQDGPKTTVTFTLAVSDNAEKDDKGRPRTDFLRFRAEIAPNHYKTSLGPYQYLDKGDLVQVEAKARAHERRDPSGRSTQDVVFDVVELTMLEPRWVKDTRRMRNAQQGANAAYGQQARQIPANPVPNGQWAPQQPPQPWPMPQQGHAAQPKQSSVPTLSPDVVMAVPPRTTANEPAVPAQATEEIPAPYGMPRPENQFSQYMPAK